MKDLEEALSTVGKISSMTMCSVEEVAEAFVRLSEALANERNSSLAGATGKFRTKSEEVEIDWIS
jgi:hypothetical protein